MRRIGRNFLDFNISDVAGQGLLNISYAVIDIFGLSLSEHLDGAVSEIADIPAQLISTRHPVSGEPEAHALNPAAEDYVPCNHKQLTIDYCPIRQYGNMLMDI